MLRNAPNDFHYVINISSFSLPFPLYNCLISADNLNELEHSKRLAEKYGSTNKFPPFYQKLSIYCERTVHNVLFKVTAIASHFFPSF